MQLSVQLQNVVLRHLTVFAVWCVGLTAAARVGLTARTGTEEHYTEYHVVGVKGFPEEGPLAHFDLIVPSQCICADLPMATTPAPAKGVDGLANPPEIVEVITTDITLANKVWQDPAGLAGAIAKELGVDPTLVKVKAKSWKKPSVLRTHGMGPILGPMPAIKGPGLLQQFSRARVSVKKCDCAQAAAVTPLRMSVPDPPAHSTAHLLSPGLPVPPTYATTTPLPTPGPDSPTTVDKLAAQTAKAGPQPPSYQVQMMTRDQCVVNQLCDEPAMFENHIAKVLGINVTQVKVYPPLIEGGQCGLGPAPAPAPMGFTTPAPVNLNLPADYTTPPPTTPAPTTSTAAPTTTPGPTIPPPGPSGNRPWIAIWKVEFLPPNATDPTERFIAAVNDPHGSLFRFLPSTLARMPNMPYPGFPNNINVNGTDQNWTLLPPPPDTSLPLGYNPGGHRSGDLGDPLGPVNLMRDPLEISTGELTKGIEIAGKIKALTARVENASNVHYEAITATSYDAPDIVPPMVVAMGPDGIHAESPYGPWEVKPPYSGTYDGKDPFYSVAKNELHASDEMVARAGGFDHLTAKLLATPFPPKTPPEGLSHGAPTFPPSFLQAHPASSPVHLQAQPTPSPYSRWTQALGL